MLLASKRALDGLADLTGMPRMEFITRIPDAPKKRAPHDPAVIAERTIVAAILKYLRAHPLIATCWRMHSGVFGDSERMMRVGTVGMPDIMGMMVGGRLYAVEVKSASGKLSEAQSAMLERIGRGGGLVCMARSVADVQTMIERA